MTFLFDTIAVVGVGLIGGSLARAVRTNRLARSITGIDTDTRNLRLAEELGVVDTGTADLSHGVRDANLVVIATPVRSIVPLTQQISRFAARDAIITDTGSVKGEIVRGVEALNLSGVSFVAGHPIAGTERSGVAAADASLFQKRKTILTPTGLTDVVSLQTVRRLWESVGSDVIFLDCDLHDQIFGAVSHLPHYIAFSLVSYLGSLQGITDDLLQFSAGGLKDFTRIAASDPTMWTDIALMNSSVIMEFIDGYQEALSSLKDLIGSGNADALLAALTNAQALRKGI